MPEIKTTHCIFTEIWCCLVFFFLATATLYFKKFQEVNYFSVTMETYKTAVP